MKYKIGKILYRASADDENKCELDTFMVRTIRGEFVYAVNKIPGITWGKLSKKNGDFGWLNPVDALFRCKTEIGTDFLTLHTTKRKAWSELLKNKKKYFSDEGKKIINNTCKRMLGRIKNEK